ncbi:Hypothetical predicted protein [Mytilus galloprovincialis]|uniref:Apple domain-containing protein n=2 Tax=Mytilus galloprovincialis TaxID=29158 RepID=A0A8B6GQ93_MYTGA|nr:Hypothetical predicted protein [Mytilus galloprovincialis]
MLCVLTRIMISIIVICMHMMSVAVLSESRLRFISAHHKPEYDDKYEVENAIGAYLVRFVGGCGIKCVSNTRCLSYFYNHLTGMCILHSDSFTHTVMSSSAKGWKFYLSQERFISECSLGGGTCDKLDSCDGAHSTGGCSYSSNAVCCFDKSYGRDGVWPGYYVHYGVQYSWSMSIQFDRNSITGGGSDSVGTFTIDGSLNPLSKDINFVKAYTSHNVSYTGQVTADVCTMYGQYTVGSTTGAFNMTICT